MNRSTILRQVLVAAIICGAYVPPVHACPSLDGIPDFNCDSSVNVVMLGDSLVSGFGDTENDNAGGYVLRASGILPEVGFSNFGEPGLRSRELLSELNTKLARGAHNALRSAVLSADLVVVDIGRNDRWLFGEPLQTFRNLTRIRDLITSRVKSAGHTPPMVVLAVLMLPNRGSQGPWVKELNALILRASTAKKPSDLRFDKVSKRLLSADQLHPTSAGYGVLASTFVRYLKKTLAPRMRKLRPDKDGDGVADQFERSKFGTDPHLADTDGDGLTDGMEIFSLATDPLDITSGPS